jgi:hypothetical protein
MSYIATIEAVVKEDKTETNKTYYINAKNQKHALKKLKTQISVDFPKNFGYNYRVIE